MSAASLRPTRPSRRFGEAVVSRDQTSGRRRLCEPGLATRRPAARLSPSRIDDGTKVSPLAAWTPALLITPARAAAPATRQYARLAGHWVAMIDLEPQAYGTHSLRRTKVALVHKKTGNLRACQLLPGPRKLESTVRYLSIEVDDAVALSEQIDL